MDVHKKKMCERKGKRAIVDVVVVLLILFSLSIGIIANDIVLTAANGSALGIQGYPHIHEGLLMNRTFNEGFLFIVIGYMLYMLISAYLIESHPIFYVIGLMIAMVGITLSEYLRAAWIQATNTTVFLTVMANYTYHTIIWNNMTSIMLGILALSLVVMYSKGSSGGGPLG